MKKKTKKREREARETAATAAALRKKKGSRLSMGRVIYAAPAPIWVAPVVIIISKEGNSSVIIIATAAVFYFFFPFFKKDKRKRGNKIPAFFYRRLSIFPSLSLSVFFYSWKSCKQLFDKRLWSITRRL